MGIANWIARDAHHPLQPGTQPRHPANVDGLNAIKHYFFFSSVSKTAKFTIL